MYSKVIQILFHYRLLWDIECSSLCYTVDPCWLSCLYIVISISFMYSNQYLLISNSKCVCPLPFPFGNHKFVSYVWIYLCFVYKFICIISDSTYKHIIYLSMYDFLSMIISRSIHVAESGIISFFFMAECSIPLYIVEWTWANSGR